MDTIPSVTSSEVSAKFVAALMVLQNSLKPVIFPIAGIAMALSIVLLLCGSLFHSKTLRKMGIVDIGISAGAVLLYFAIPLILGILKAMGNALN